MNKPNLGESEGEFFVTGLKFGGFLSSWSAERPVEETKQLFGFLHMSTASFAALFVCLRNDFTLTVNQFTNPHVHFHKAALECCFIKIYFPGRSGRILFDFKCIRKTQIVKLIAKLYTCPGLEDFAASYSTIALAVGNSSNDSLIGFAAFRLFMVMKLRLAGCLFVIKGECKA